MAVIGEHASIQARIDSAHACPVPYLQNASSRDISKDIGAGSSYFAIHDSITVLVHGIQMASITLIDLFVYAVWQLLLVYSDGSAGFWNGYTASGD